MDFDGEPSRFLEHDVDMGSRILSLSGAVSLPRWHGHGPWNQHSSDSKTPPSSTSVTGRRLQPGTHGAKLVRSSTRSWMSTKPTDLLSEHTVVRQEQPTEENNDSYIFTDGEESTETENGVVVRNLSLPPSSWKSGQWCKPKRGTEDQLLNLVDFVPAQADHSVILSAISGRRESKDEKSVARKEFRHDDNDAQSSVTQASHVQSSAVLHQRQQSATSHQQRNLFGLPDRITVSKREINMMSPSSF